jgi:Glycosyl hydrolase family 99
MPWFQANPSKKQWGWHWRMNAFDPEKMVEGRREIASHYYPTLGPYDSGDSAVVTYHLKLMKAAGVDGVIIDWYGLSDLYDYPLIHLNTQTLFPIAESLSLKVGICYEDQTVSRLVEAKKITPAHRVDNARHELDWVAKNWFSRPNYLRLGGKPVLLSFGNDGLTDAEWEAVLSPQVGKVIYLSEHRRRFCASGGFDWPIPQRGLSQLDAFDEARKVWPVSMPVAFPRFHDIYRAGKAQIGYDQIDDNSGKTFATTLARALRSGAPLVQIATWNDWGEGTGIEPTREFGFRDLETIQRLRKSILDPRFHADPKALMIPPPIR